MHNKPLKHQTFVSSGSVPKLFKSTCLTRTNQIYKAKDDLISLLFKMKIGYSHDPNTRQVWFTNWLNQVGCWMFGIQVMI